MKNVAIEISIDIDFSGIFAMEQEIDVREEDMMFANLSWELAMLSNAYRDIKMHHVCEL